MKNCKLVLDHDRGLKIGRPALLFFILIFAFSTVPFEARAATTISKSLRRPVNEIGLVGWWTMDGPDTLTNIADKSGQGNHGSLSHGGSGTTTAPGRVGQALNFDGVNDYVSTTNTNFPDTSSSDYTISAWVKPSSIPAGSNPRIFVYATDANNGIKLAFGGAGCTANFIFEPKKAGTNYGGCATTTTFSVNMWYHLVGVFQSSSNTVTFYISNVVQSTSGFAGGLPSTTGTGYIGVSNAASFFPGSLDDVRVYNRALSAAEVLRLYQIGATSKIAKTLPGRDSLTSGLVGWWTFDGPDMLTNVADKSGQGNNGSLIHAGSGTTTAPGRVGQALNFDGTNDWVNTTTDVGGLDAKTFAGWFRWNSLGSGWQMMVMDSDPVFDNVNYVGLSTVQNATKYIDIFQSYNGGLSAFETGTDFEPSLNTWYHVAGVIDKADNSLRLYINGALYSTYQNAAVGASTFYNPSGGAGIGGKPSAGYYFNGNIDDVRVYNRALSAAEVLRLYQIGATSKIAKTLPGRDSLTSGLVGWWTMDGPDTLTNIADKSGQGNHGSLIHGGSGTTTAPGPVGQALEFDGTNDYASASAVNLSATNVVSVSFWLYQNAYGTDDDLMLEFTSNTNSFTTGFFVDPNTGSVPGACTGLFYINLKGDVGNNGTCYAQASANAWHHYVAIYNKGSANPETSLYRDGVLLTAAANPDTSNNTNNFGNDTLYMMSRGGSTLFNKGKLDDIRLYNRALSAAEVLQLYNLGR